MSPERPPPRVLALVVPELPLQRILRSRPPARALAVVAEGTVRHATPAALQAGVRPGDSLVQARAACAALEAVPLDAAADRAALRALAEALLALSPAVEVAPPDAVLLDAAGARLAGREPAAAEQALAEAALALCGEMGWQARVAVADGKAVAQALARHAGRERVRAAPGEGARGLAPLPVESLGLSSEVGGWLGAVGITTVGALAALPAGSLAQRFGAAGAAAARLARGEDGRPLVPFRPETFPREGWDLEAEVGVLSSAEPVLFAVKRLADRVAARLAGRGMGASRLRLTLRLDPRGEERMDLPLSRPGADAAAWMLPLRERLSGLRLPAPVRALDLAVVEAAEVPAEQLAVGDRPEVARALEVALARLAARLGEGALFAAETADRHRPEAAYRPAPFRRAAPPPLPPAPPRDAATAEPVVPPGRPTRLLDPPLPAVALGDGGRLTALRVDGAVRAVQAVSGPERLAGEWWGHPFDRDYWRLRLEGLGEAWVYRDGRDGRLWLHGLFD
ncbi:MAG TPA: DNA polymerase Y family protein [Anaeromyxobacteraceae bacterium]|nr:DNA polymerase Y family protein [Anaeromyxobacteraceae bacterium]